MGRTSTKDLIDQSVGEAVKKALINQNETQSGELASSTQESLDSQEEEAIQAGLDEDVFEMAEERVRKLGDSVCFEIYKDGTRMRTMSYPYSWEKVQKDFGAGVFRVVGRSIRTKKIFRHSTESLAALPENTEGFSFDEPADPAPAPGASMSELFMFMDRQEEKRRRESEAAEERRRLSDREARESNREFIKTMAALVTPLLPVLLGRREEPKGIDQNIMEFLKTTVDSQNQMIDRLQDRVEKATSGSTPQDPMSALTLMQSLEDRAFSRIKMMEELASEKAEEIASRSGGSGGNEQEKSVFESMMSTMLPAIAQGIVGMGQPGQPAQAPAPQAALPEPRRLHQPGAPASNRQDGRRAEGHPRTQAQSPARPASPSGQGAGPEGPRKVAQAPSRSFMGLPRAVAKPAPLQAVIVSPESPEKPEPAAPAQKEIVMEQKETPEAKVVRLLVPLIKSGLEARMTGAKVAEDSIGCLKENGLNPSEALRSFTWEHVEGLVDVYHVPVLLKPAVLEWLRGYHQELTAKSQAVA